MHARVVCLPSKCLGKEEVPVTKPLADFRGPELKQEVKTKAGLETDVPCRVEDTSTKCLRTSDDSLAYR